MTFTLLLVDMFILSLWMTLQDILLMVGPYGDWVKYNIEDHTVLVSECDGVRLISAQQHELLSRVSDSQVDIFKIGSTAPGVYHLQILVAYFMLTDMSTHCLQNIPSWPFFIKHQLGVAL